jgi:hypothetical protein
MVNRSDFEAGLWRIFRDYRVHAPFPVATIDAILELGDLYDGPAAVLARRAVLAESTSSSEGTGNAD